MGAGIQGKQQRLLKMLRLLERPGSAGEATAAKNRIASLLANPEINSWVQGALDGRPSVGVSRQRLEQQAEGYRVVLEQQKTLIDRLMNENERLKTSASSSRNRESELRHRLWLMKGDPALPQPGLSTQKWWDVLVGKGDGVVFNASAMSEAFGAPSRRSLVRLAQKLSFRELWKAVGQAPRPQEWRALEEGLAPEKVADVMWLFGVDVSSIIIQAPDGRRLTPGRDFLWSERRQWGERA